MVSAKTPDIDQRENIESSCSQLKLITYVSVHISCVAVALTQYTWVTYSLLCSIAGSYDTIGLAYTPNYVTAVETFCKPCTAEKM